MKRAQPRCLQAQPSLSHGLTHVSTHLLAAALLVAVLSPAAAQDIRGLEVCTAEKQMDRRTGCLQANTEFLQQALGKLARETDEKFAAADRNLAAARAEIVALRSTIEKLSNELAQVKAKADPHSKK
jgi:plasmid stabilization system protein ParE